MKIITFTILCIVSGCGGSEYAEAKMPKQTAPEKPASCTELKAEYETMKELCATHGPGGKTYYYCLFANNYGAKCLDK
jgi:hypothetical protein